MLFAKRTSTIKLHLYIMLELLRDIKVLSVKMLVTKTEGLLQTIFFSKKILLIMSVINRIPYVLLKNTVFMC